MKKIFGEFRVSLQTAHPLVVAMFILSVVGMNLLANKSIDTGVSWLALDCGIILSWLTFMSMDIFTHCYGPRCANALSFTAIIVNLFMALIFFIAGSIPGVWGESFVDGSEALINNALNNTFRGTWFVLLGSTIAFSASALLNNFLNYGISKLFKNNDRFVAFAIKSYVSTIVAQFFDNIIFALIVSKLFFGWTLLQCFSCAATGAVLELVFEVFVSPLGFKISRKMMRQGELK